MKLKFGIGCEEMEDRHAKGWDWCEELQGRYRNEYMVSDNCRDVNDVLLSAIEEY
ncbi:hypothetical protein A2U01_0082723, partial [Trifolium medium]|nr:hypothetical protein [Trifolium medium]